MRKAAIVVLLCLAGVARPASAQIPNDARFLSPKAVAESLAVLKQLSDSVWKRYKNAAAWYRQGTIAAALYQRCRSYPPVKGLDCTKPRLLADSAFLIARELEPTNVEYVRALGRFLLASDVQFNRDATYFSRLFGSALATLRAKGNKSAYAEAAVDAGRFYWLEYDAAAHDTSETTPVPLVRARAAALTAANRKSVLITDPDNTDLPIAPREILKQARNQLDARRLRPADGFSGEIDYLMAEMLFRDAFESAPGNLRAYRSFAMLLAERNRWGELAAAARARTNATHTDGWAWMTLATATYRQGSVIVANALFDSAAKYLAPAELKRLDQINRVLGTGQKMSYANVPEQQRSNVDRMYWLSADPLWSRDDDQPHIEFLARVAYAEIVWSSDEVNQRGADSDRGAVYIKFGPPDRIARSRGTNCTSGCGAENSAPDIGFGLPPTPVGATPPCERPKRSLGEIYFDYDFSGMRFRFPRVPKYTCREFAEDSISHERASGNFTNLIKGRIDSIPVQIARFRAAGDLTDVLLATLPPIDAIHRASDVIGPVRTDFWFVTQQAVLAARDSITASTTGTTSITRRLSPGDYVYRAEASADGSLVAGRASAAFTAGNDQRTGYSSAGFGISDLLVALRAAPRGGPVRRWTDLDIAPLAGSAASNSDLSVVWENYDFANDNGTSRYGVIIMLRRERPDTSTVPNIAARVISGIADAIGFDRKLQQDRVEFVFDRTVPYSPTIVDVVTLTLGETPPGSYILLLEVTDRVTGKSIVRSQRLQITAPVPK